MKQKFLSFFLVCCLLAFYLPVSADAADKTISPAVTPMISVGYTHSVALRSDGTVWAWGANNFGQLGDGTTESKKVPVQVSGLTDVIQIAAGNYFTLALKRDGTVWAWGDNHYGQLGNNGYENSPIPVRVQGLEGVAATSIYAGGDNGGVLDADGALWMWGDNSFRQISNSTQQFAIKVAENIQAVSIGSGFVMALGTDGKLRLRGSNRYGQIGNGESGSGKKVSSFYEVPLSGVSSFSAGESHAVAKTSDGMVYAWGSNQAGQLGNGESGSELLSAVPLAVNITDVAAVYTGGFCTYAKKENGDLWGWGNNGWGQLGADLPAQVATPARLTLPGISAVTSIDSNSYHTLFLDQEGKVWGMGSNANDQLGNNGPSSAYDYPVNVVNPDGNGVFNLFVDPSGNTNVKATAVIPAPTYIVTIPAEIDFGTITKSETESIKTQPIAVSASDVADLDGKSVDVSVTGSFSLSSGENTLPFEVYKQAEGGTALASGDSFAAFTADGSVTGRLQLDESDITAAGDYTGIMTFTVALADG